MVTHTAEVKNSKEIFYLINDAWKKDLNKAEKELVQSLTTSYQEWYNDIIDPVQMPPRKKIQRWQEGEPSWVLLTDGEDSILGYVAVSLATRLYRSISPGKILDVVVREDQNLLAVTSELRSAVNDLFWFHGSISRDKLK
jgi:hypothetical protein